MQEFHQNISKIMPAKPKTHSSGIGFLHAFISNIRFCRPFDWGPFDWGPFDL